jgi:hypothetical protein
MDAIIQDREDELEILPKNNLGEEKKDETEINLSLPQVEIDLNEIEEGEILGEALS